MNRLVATGLALATLVTTTTADGVLPQNVAQAASEQAHNDVFQNTDQNTNNEQALTTPALPEQLEETESDNPALGALLEASASAPAPTTDEEALAALQSSQTAAESPAPPLEEADAQEAKSSSDLPSAYISGSQVAGAISSDLANAASSDLDLPSAVTSGSELAGAATSTSDLPSVATSDAASAAPGPDLPSAYISGAELASSATSNVEGPSPSKEKASPLQPPAGAAVDDQAESVFEATLDGQTASMPLLSENVSKLDEMIVTWLGKDEEGEEKGEAEKLAVEEEEGVEKAEVSAKLAVKEAEVPARVEEEKVEAQQESPVEEVAKIMVQRIVTDDDLATAAANVRKSWQILAPERIGALVKAADGDSSTAMQVAMLASVLADIVGNLDFVKNATEPLVFIRGQTVGQGSKSTSTTTPRASLGLLAGSALGFPLSLANRASQSFIGQAIGGSGPKSTYPLAPATTPFANPLAPPASQLAAPAGQLAAPFGQLAAPAGQPAAPAGQQYGLPAPTLRSSPFSSLWPNGAIPKLQSDGYTVAKNRVPSFTPASYSSPTQNAWNLYNSLIPRKLSEEGPSFQTEETPSFQSEGHKERFGNFLHDELPRELKRKIWDDFVSDSRRAKSVEEQNALLRKLERGQDFARTRSPPRRRLIEARPLSVSEKVSYGAGILREQLVDGKALLEPLEFSTVLVEAARLFLATLEPESQSRLMKMLVENGVEHDGAFIEYKKKHEIDSELQIGLLLLHRLRNVLIKADF